MIAVVQRLAARQGVAGAVAELPGAQPLAGGRQNRVVRDGANYGASALNSKVNLVHCHRNSDAERLSNRAIKSLGTTMAVAMFIQYIFLG